MSELEEAEQRIRHANPAIFRAIENWRETLDENRRIKIAAERFLRERSDENAAALLALVRG